MVPNFYLPHVIYPPKILLMVGMHNLSFLSYPSHSFMLHSSYPFWQCSQRDLVKKTSWCDPTLIYDHMENKTFVPWLMFSFLSTNSLMLLRWTKHDAFYTYNFIHKIDEKYGLFYIPIVFSIFSYMRVYVWKMSHLFHQILHIW